MCGICGQINLHNDRPVTYANVKAMADMLRHRGPDEEGYHIERNVGLGHRRLSIIDLDTGRQPIYSEDEFVCVVFNGEIYNFLELREWLEAKGHVFYTRTDTEVIVHLYEELGPEAFRRLRGMFALALWDKRAHELYLVRDRFGIKPLYVLEHRGRLYFASEIKAFLRIPGWTPELDLETLPHYLNWMFTPGERTLVRGVRKLLPGHYLRVKQGGSVQQIRYFGLDASVEDGRTSEQYLAELRRTLAESVRLRMMADVPVGAFLSGGVDSSLVVALMASFSDSAVHTFSVGFRERDFDELPYARIVARHLGTEHHELVVTPGEVLAHMEEAVYHRDEPLAYPSDVATLLLSRLAARFVKVVLSGEGGDELFAGYPKHVAEQLAPALSLLPPGLRRTALQGLAAKLPFGARRLRIALRSLALADPAQRWTSWFAAFDDEIQIELLKARVARKGAIRASDEADALLKQAPFQDPLRRHLYLDMSWWLPDNLLQKGDKMSMAASLEERVPLLDQEVVRLAFAMPKSLKVRGRKGKLALRRLLKEVLPKEICDRKKVGFSLPVGRWFQREWSDWLKDLLFSPRTLGRGYFRDSSIRRLVEEHQAGRIDRQRELWLLANFELWHRIFLDGEWRQYASASEDPPCPARRPVKIVERYA